MGSTSFAARPRLFVGCSTQGGLDVARRLQEELSADVEVVLWSQGVFKPGEGHLEALSKACSDFDFAALVLSPDDLVVGNGATGHLVPRDNVIFELGLFMGRLGRERTFLVMSQDAQQRLPSDLSGVTAAQFNGPYLGATRQDVAVACGPIRDAIKRHGRAAQRFIDTHPLAPRLLQFMRSTSEALGLGYRALTNEVERRVDGWSKKAAALQSGVATVQTNYTIVLTDVYRYAERNIFSTSIPDYLPAWETPWGRSLVHVQHDNREAKSTRVFIFRSRSALGPETRRLLEFHASNRIEVLLHFADEHASTFPPDLGNDWTVVDDGLIVGITHKLGDLYEATWYFGKTEEQQRFMGYCEKLRAASEPFVPS
jgi:hypothetical protein